MLCENCGNNEAAIHLTQIQNNEMTTRHLCEPCAEQMGLSSGAPVNAPLADFIAQMGKAIASETVAAAGTCPSCGLTLADFKKTGRLGCARCYGAFERSLRELLRRLHGNSRHTGRRYAAPAPELLEHANTVGQLRERLRRAIANEQFELAAELRDRLRTHERAEG